MTVTDKAPAETDAKAGWCTNCRKGSHVLCTAPVCACPRADHPARRRPVAAPPVRPAAATAVPQPPKPEPAAPAAPGASEGTPPQVVWRDPPAASRGGPSPVPAGVREALRARPGAWALVKIYPSKSGAASAASHIAKGSIGPGFEARGAARLGVGSQLFVRYVGDPDAE